MVSHRGDLAYVLHAAQLVITKLGDRKLCLDELHDVQGNRMIVMGRMLPRIIYFQQV